MSAFICNQSHINAIVDFFSRTQGKFYINTDNYDPRDTDDLNLIGQILTDENYRSVNTRYNETDKPEKFCHDFGRHYSPIQILKAIDCLEYQSCESSNYHESIAYKISSDIRRRAIVLLPGYEEAQWEIAE